MISAIILGLGIGLLVSHQAADSYIRGRCEILEALDATELDITATGAGCPSLQPEPTTPPGDDLA